MHNVWKYGHIQYLEVMTARGGLMGGVGNEEGGMHNTILVRIALFVLCATCRYSAADRDWIDISTPNFQLACLPCESSQNKMLTSSSGPWRAYKSGSRMH